LTIVAALPLTVQMAGVVDENSTGSPLDAVAESGTGVSANGRSAIAGNEIVWPDLPT
jgi:hypothetical protein